MLNILWKKNILVITYETDNAYYGKRYERHEIINIHPLLNSVLENCFAENKAIVDIKDNKAIITYNILHECNNYTFELTADLQNHKTFSNKIFDLETKTCYLDKQIDANDEVLDEIEQHGTLLEKRLDALYISIFGDTTPENYQCIEKISDKLNNIENNISEKLDSPDLDDYVQDDQLNEKIEALEKQFDEKIDDLKDGICCDFISYSTACEIIEETAEEIKKDILQLKLATDEKADILSRDSHEFKRIIHNLQEKNKELDKKYTALSDYFDMFIFVIVVYCVLSIVKLFM